MEQYLTHTDYALWEVIMNSDSPASIASVSGGAEATIPPKTTEQKIARRNELKAKSFRNSSANWKFMVYEAEIKGQSSSSSNSQNVAFVSSDNTSSTNEAVNTAHDVSAASSQGQAFTLTYADDIMFSFFANQSNSPHQISPKDKTGLGYDSQLNGSDLNNKSNVFESASDSSVNESEKDNNQANDRYKAGERYHAVPPPYTGNFMPLRPDLSFSRLDDSVFKSARNGIVTSVHETETSASKTSKESMEKPKSVRSSALIIEDWESDSDDDCEIRTSIKQNKPRKSVLNNKGKATGQKEVRPVWNNTQRVNHQNFSNNLTHPHLRRNFVPTTVITNSGKVPVNTAKQSSPRAAASTSTVRYINTAATRPTVNGAKPSLNVFHKSHLSVRRTFNQTTTPKHSDLKETINTTKVNNVTSAGTKAVVSAIQGNRKNAVKSSACWIWRPT
nr:hypothetical protein [Tanacetum cinerariifolium]